MPTNEKLFGWLSSEESKTSFSSFKFEIPDDILASLLFELLMRYLFTLVRRKISSACLCLRSKIMTKKQNWWNDSGARPQVQQTFHNNSEQEGTDAGGTDDTHPDEPMVLTQLLSQKTTWWLNWEVHKMSTDRNKTNRAADWIHDSTVITNFSKLQFTVQWLPKLTYGCCWCRTGFLHLHAARKRGNARCKSYSNALLWTRKRKNCSELRNTSEASLSFWRLISHHHSSFQRIFGNAIQPRRWKEKSSEE